MGGEVRNQVSSMKILTAAQMREVDRLTTEKHGISQLQLMENAGAAFVSSIWKHVPALVPARIAVLCGKGNNGGDGLVIARKLKEAGFNVHVVLLASESTVKGEAATNLKLWKDAGGSLAQAMSAEEWNAARDSSVSSCSVVIDALLGTGTTGPVEGLLARVIADVNRLRDTALVFSVDVPSGVPSDGPIGNWPAVRAHFTTTFTAPKLGLIHPANSEYVGRLRVEPIGSPRELVESFVTAGILWSDAKEFRAFARPREASTHKGTYGHVLIVAGSRGKAGAAALAGMGALHSGAGLVTITTPEGSLPAVAGHAPELMTEPLPETDTGSISLRALDYARFEKLQEDKTVLAIGPGLGTNPETQEFIRTIVSRAKLPVILDADGLNAFAGRADELAHRQPEFLAVTPHPGEMARLLGCAPVEVQSRRTEIAQECAVRWKAHVLLKGHLTLIASPGGEVFVNSTGNPGMATGGSGDVLTGVLAGLTAQHGVSDWLRVLAYGAFLHGLAGDRAAMRCGEAGLVASDILAELGGAQSSIRTNGWAGYYPLD